MNRKVFYLQVLIAFLVLLMAAPPWILAQSPRTGSTLRQEELEQMLAPIALYPDSLLGQILVAATYPDQVRQADQWVRQNNNLQGDDLNAALDRMDWDLSVKALVPFPQVLSMMSNKMDWTQRLGNAFLARQADVMDTIQRLRAKAYAAGNLNNTDQQKVVVQGEIIKLEPVDPRVIYVPTYNPVEIYGCWCYPAYPPYAYTPYYPHYAYDPHYTGVGFITSGLFVFAAGIAVGSVWNSGWGHWDWGRRNVNVNINRTININRNDIRSGDIRTSSWHDVNRQRGSIARSHGQRGASMSSGKSRGGGKSYGAGGKSRGGDKSYGAGGKSRGGDKSYGAGGKSRGGDKSYGAGGKSRGDGKSHGGGGGHGGGGSHGK